MTLEGSGHFGNRKKAYSIWIGVRAAPELLTLRDRIDRALASCGLAYESRKYAPHVTIARLGRARPDHVRAWLEGAARFAAPPFEARESRFTKADRGVRDTLTSPWRNSA